MRSLLSILLVGPAVLAAKLTQLDTNGLSVWGTLKAPTLDKFLTNNPLPLGFPWGDASAKRTNPYTDPPHTGVVRKYDFTITRSKLAPDGYLKDVILINGQYPGPLIEANWGDIVEVTVHNQIFNRTEGTALHWHGFLQKETPWYDGVPSVQQCPIAPGASFTYRFQADLYGTTWYHSHYSAQYAGGLHGPFIVHGPNHVPYDIDLGPIFINDWYHKDYHEVVKMVTGLEGGLDIPTPLAPNSDNNLINGKNSFDCSSLVNDTTPCTNDAGISKFKLTSGKTHRLRLINSGAEGIQKFSIDGHTLTVIANDFVPIEPYDTKIATIGIGQRSDVLVKANGKPKDVVYMRSFITECATANNPLALAAVYYEDADLNATPNSTAWVDDTDPCTNDDLSKTVPYYPLKVNRKPDVTQEVTISGGFNSSGNFNFFMNNQTFRANFNNPLLLLAHQGNVTYPYNPEWNVYNFKKAKTIRFVLYNDFPAAHPMHMHGHNMQVLSVGDGRWDGKTIVNADNPQRRDVQTLPKFSHMVVQIDADNPGVWPFHCHIAWHVSQGLYLNIMERPDDIKQMQIPMIMEQTCRDWTKYTDNNIVDVLDSGLRLT